MSQQANTNQPTLRGSAHSFTVISYTPGDRTFQIRNNLNPDQRRTVTLEQFALFIDYNGRLRANGPDAGFPEPLGYAEFALWFNLEPEYDGSLATVGHRGGLNINGRSPTFAEVFPNTNLHPEPAQHTTNKRRREDQELTADELRRKEIADAAVYDQLAHHQRQRAFVTNKIAARKAKRGGPYQTGGGGYAHGTGGTLTAHHSLPSQSGTPINHLAPRAPSPVPSGIAVLNPEPGVRYSRSGTPNPFLEDNDHVMEDSFGIQQQQQEPEGGNQPAAGPSTQQQQEEAPVEEEATKQPKKKKTNRGSA
ncbi:hypothetical protein D9613_012786 [Agrocybe pediades]|uniref:Uncharacterized protein n=1 Tax=Agrocybe pediades TaxID=84607 RepID=A0A8H4R2J3_9AGAR|nr:hypothetical protein D9613_012786 [Agrocybe pediades]